jgi:murein DD-endopeptidase MepM/ murein hydrolase activator NlpD
MAKPSLNIAVEPSNKSGKAYYLPLAPKAESEPERLKIVLRLVITNNGSESVTVTNIRFAFPGSSISEVPMEGEQLAIRPEGGVIAPGESAKWSNGRVVMENEESVRNEVYLDAPAPPQITVKVECAGFSQPATKTMDLIPYSDPTGEGPVIMPFAASNLESGEYVVTSAVHYYNGGENGTQIFAHDISIQVQDNGDWTRLHPNTQNTEVSDHRIYGKPVRAMAEGKILQVADEWEDTPIGGEREENVPVEGNNVRVRHGNLEIQYSHLRPGSIVVNAGDEVVAGQKLGEAGNSGNTSSPHLHIECRDTCTGALRGFAFKRARILERSQVEQNGTGPWVTMDAQGVCREKAAIRPLPRYGSAGPELDVTKDMLEDLVAQVFGGLAKGGDGFVIVGGKIVRVPPRGPKWALLQSLIAFDAAEQIDHATTSRILREIADTISKISKDLGKQR